MEYDVVSAVDSLHLCCFNTELTVTGVLIYMWLEFVSPGWLDGIAYQGSMHLDIGQVITGGIAFIQAQAYRGGGCK